MTGLPAAPEPSVGDVQVNLQAVRARIARAAQGRPVRVVAVTKGFGPAAIRAALAAGLEDVGENYAQELLAKRAALGEQASACRWHHLGALHRRQARRLAGQVDLFHSVVRVEEAEAIAAGAPGQAVLVQLELSGRADRRGVQPEDLFRLLPDLRRAGVQPIGVMTLGVAGNPQATAAVFEQAAALAAAADLPEVSMGMSDDFELAVARGATIVRIGRALFGPRPQPGQATKGPPPG